MNNEQSKAPVPMKDSLMKGVITIDELAEKMGVDPEELFSSLEAEKFPMKRIGKHVFIRILDAKRYVMKPNVNINGKNEQMEP